MIHYRHKNGYTLLELSIVILIIGILVAGSLVGRNLMRESELRNAIGEYGMYVKAIQEFQDKYHATPGDMNNATTLWDTDPAGCTAGAATAYNTVRKTATCNGDGLGTVGTSTLAGVPSGSNEWWRAWQHLSNANLIKGKFTGAQGAAGVGNVNQATPSLNVPASDLGGAGWTLLYYLQTSDPGPLWADTYGHVLLLGAAVTGTYTKGAALSPPEAMNIENKLDDGMPGTGKVRAWRSSVLANCTAPLTDTSQTAQFYNVAVDEHYCSLVFLLRY